MITQVNSIVSNPSQQLKEVIHTSSALYSSSCRSRTDLNKSENSLVAADNTGMVLADPYNAVATVATAATAVAVEEMNRC